MKKKNTRSEENKVLSHFEFKILKILYNWNKDRERPVTPGQFCRMIWKNRKRSGRSITGYSQKAAVFLWKLQRMGLSSYFYNDFSVVFFTITTLGIKIIEDESGEYTF